MIEAGAVDHAGGAVLETERLPALVGDNRHRAPAPGPDDLERHASQSPGGAPDEHGVARFDLVSRPAHQHAIGRGGAEQIASGFFPGEPLGLGNALMRLGPRELAVAAVVRLIAPDPRAFGEHRIAP